jgi:hypothetical protein
MQIESHRLLDEALEQEPIKNTFRLAWEFIVLNKNFTFTALSLLLLLNILSAFLGFFAMIISGIFSMAIQIYVARVLYASKDIENFVQKSKASKIEDALSQHILSGMGAYFGTLLLFLVILFLAGFMISSLNVNVENIETAQLLEMGELLLFPALILLLIVSYLHPLVQANITFSNDFKEGFRAVFTFFTQALWRDAFQKRYFNYMALIFVVVIVIAIVLGLFITIPGINLLANFIVIVAMYFYAIVGAVVAMMAKRVVE